MHDYKRQKINTMRWLCFYLQTTMLKVTNAHVEVEKNKWDRLRINSIA